MSKWPITIIDIAGYTKPIFSKLQSKQRARQIQYPKAPVLKWGIGELF
jgi:hypothetical protein